VGGDPDQVYPAVLQFDNEEDVQPGQADRFDGEEVAGQRSGRLGAQKLRPRRSAAAGCRPEVVTAQDGAHRGRRDPDAELAALADDAQVPPPRVLPGQPQHEVDRLRVQSSPATTGRVRPVAADQFAVPPQQGRRGDQEDRPPVAGQQLRHGGQDHPVGRCVAGSSDLAAQDRELVAEHRDLDVFGVR
jgi:hypothetical protein